jgi:mannan endo-1,4-beta-mannosidase
MVYKTIKQLTLLLLTITLFVQCDALPGESPEEEEPLTKPELISPIYDAENQSTEVDLKWRLIRGAQEYQVQVSDSDDFENLVFDELVEGTSATITGLEYSTTYYWKVLPLKRNHQGPWSDTWKFTTSDQDLDPVSVDLISPRDGAETEDDPVTFEWEEVSEAANYHYQLSEDDSFSELIVDSTVTQSQIQVTFDEVPGNGPMYWRVSPNLQSAPSEWSEIRSVTVVEPQDEPGTPAPPATSFVTVQNGDFYLEGEPFHFAGTNAYYLPNYEKINSGVVDRAFDVFEDAGITVIRMWAFYDGYDCGYSQYDASENVIQTAPGEYSESALRDLDRVIAKGKERGIRFILPFINYWDELGGICQYNTWAGASNPGRNMDFFINNEDTQQWFRDYIDMLLNRTNTVTGVKYKDEPAIMAWQIMNEGRNRGQDPQILRDWYQEIAQYIKSIDSNHLVSTGEEGFDEGVPSEYSSGEYSNTYVLRAQEGTSYVMNTAIPEIDFGSAHWYPQDWGFGNEINSSLLRAQRAWIDDHLAIAQSHGKPLIIGEYGFTGWGDDRVYQMYDALFEHAENTQVGGTLLWQLTADGTKCWEFGGNICYPGGREDTALYNLLKNHVDNMNNLR